MHIVAVAQAQSYKIPLCCFNKRYWYSQNPERHQCTYSSQPSSQKNDLPPEQDQHSPDKTNDEIEIIPGSEQHITEAHMNEMHGSDEEIKIRGIFRALELKFLQNYLPNTNYDTAVELLKSVNRTLEQKIEELGNAMEEPRVVVPHPIQPVGKNSYKTRPLMVAEACTAAMKRNTPSASAQHASPPAKKRNTPSEK